MTDSKKKKSKAQTIGRTVAFQTLYQEELNPSSPADVPFDAMWDELFAQYCEDAEVAPSDEQRAAAFNFGRNLFLGVIDRRCDIDAALNNAFDNRTLKHTTPVDRSILRLAAYEMLYVKTPRAIVISEALELGKKFGDKNSRAFLNGVLDQIGKQD